LHLKGKYEGYVAQRLFLTRRPPVDQVFFIHEVSRSHTTTHYSR